MTARDPTNAEASPFQQEGVTEEMVDRAMAEAKKHGRGDPDDSDYIGRRMMTGLLGAALIPFRSVAVGEPVVSVKTMKMSDGRVDYFVSVMVDDREMTPRVFRIKGRAEFEVETWKWLFGQGDEPNIMDWLDRTADPATPTPENPNG